jgi:aldoxime dehydratase
MTPENICVIRTGQDWSGAPSDEEASCLETAEPSIKISLEFMNNVGHELGCLCSRYARLVDSAGKPMSKAFNMSVWLNLARLEHWAGSHWTHLASYGSLAKHSARFGDEMRLSRYHEVLVPASDQVILEYRNCHAKTGLCSVVADIESEHQATSDR